MDLNKLMIDFLSKEGYRPEETPFGIHFKVEGHNYLYFKDEDDDQYFRLALPRIFEVNDDNEDIVLRAINSVNNDAKVVKTYIVDLSDENEKDMSVWVTFELFADSTPELDDFVPRALQLLRYAASRFHDILQSIAG